ncbi:DnaD domain protein [Bacillus cereus]|uniref:DnaD domain-containing protein n=1 Tax=Bacillus cereus group TaxID=86661 RepID=UPI000BF76AB2|nr:MULTISPECIES: DnaD domain protein [Bacillus cereus group]MCH5471715.1 DnaD domain protein [Bacillus cereus]PEW88404.1 primosomal replication protein N [Bacillus thuringiensis]PGS67471.1 primosomal replication protein N [Bacillus thuringiensis]HDX9494673.1 DnaD domain protein [Bacillus thuringiensis]HDX9619966.1 DnaD domain protein [Bacillus thuringiensis]
MNIKVLQIGQINFRGNVIDHGWFKTLTLDNGKPNIVAITILGEIVYWYKPTEVRSEESSQVQYKQKFKADTLQKSYQQLADLFGFTKRQVKEACDFLKERGLIKIEFRTILVNGTRCNNVMYVEPVPEMVQKISIMYWGNGNPPTLKSNSPVTLESKRVLHSKAIPFYDKTEESLTLERKTNTEITTNITTNKNDDDATSTQKLIDQEFKISYNFLLEKGIPLSEIAIQELGEFCDRFGNELVIHAVNKAIDENVPKWRYIRSILSSWEKEKVKTLNDVAALDTRFEMSKKNNKRTGKGYSKRTEVVPDWLRKQEEQEPIQQPQQTQSDDFENNKKRLDEILNKYKNTKGE